MIDPTQVIKFDRTQAELEEFWLFCTVVAGKTATTQAKALDRLLTTHRVRTDQTPMQIVGALGFQLRITEALREARLGQYNRLTKCWLDSMHLDLRHHPVERFEQVHGVGPKTARMFIMQSRPAQRYAALDTHVLKHLNAKGYDAPKATPSSPKVYRQLELCFLDLADAAGMSPTDYDMQVWREYARPLKDAQ